MTDKQRIKRISFYANPLDQEILERILTRRQHWTTAHAFREALYDLDKKQEREDLTEALLEHETHLKIADRLFPPFHFPQDPEALAAAIEREITTLPDDIQQVLRLRETMTYTEIAQALGTNRDKVRQLEAKGLRMLRHPKRGLQKL